MRICATRRARRSSVTPQGSLDLSPSPARIRSTIAAVRDQPEELREIRLLHKALADVNRLRIVRRLAAHPATVTELVEHVGLSQPLVSWHLGRLRAAGLVEARRTGREIVHRVVTEAWDRYARREREVLGLDRAADQVEVT